MTDGEQPQAQNWSHRRKLTVWAVLIALLAGLWAAYFFRPMPIPPAPDLATLGASIEEGEYLAKIGNCAACHTRKGGTPFAGGAKFVTDFGTLYSSNITPDRETGIGTWSFADFYTAMKHGVRPDGTHLYPAFPYTFFANMTDRDIGSLYLYFAALHPLTSESPENEMDFPFSERGMLHFWNRMFHDGDAARSESAQSISAQEGAKRGKYLVEAVAHCGACHTPRNSMGALDSRRQFQGGVYIDETARGTHRPWSAPDITSGRRGLADWSAGDIAMYLSTGTNRHAVVHGPMTEVFGSTEHLRAGDAAAIAAYLKTLSVPEGLFGGPLFSAGSNEGETVYTVHCGTCHLPDGKGDKALGVSLRGNPIVQADDPASLINVILYGPQLPAAPFETGRSNMKPFGKRLSDEDIAALASYLRGNFGNHAGSVSAEQVARQR